MNMIQEFIYKILQRRLEKQKQDLIRLKWERQKWESAVEKLARIDEDRKQQDRTS